MADKNKVESPKAGAKEEVETETNPPSTEPVAPETSTQIEPEVQSEPEVKSAEPDHPDLEAPKKSGVGKFGVPVGQQVSLLQANEEAWRNDEAIKEERRVRAMQIADAMVSGDGLRRTRRAQKNLR